MIDPSAADLRAAGLSLREIGKRLGINASTVLRNLRKPPKPPRPVKPKRGRGRPKSPPSDHLVEAIRRGIDEHLGPTAIAEEIGMSAGMVYRIADHAGLPVRRGRVSPPPSLRRLVQDMPMSEALEYVLEAYEQMLNVEDTRLMELVEAGLTHQQALIYALMEERKGHVVPFENLHVAASHLRPEPMSMNTLKVQVCHVRKVIKDWPVEIINIWGVGYCLKDKTL